MSRLSARTRNGRRGAAMVEMALVLPVFMMVTLGIIEFGRALWVANIVTNAAREATRAAALDGSSNASVTEAAKEFLTGSLSVAGADVNVSITITPADGNPNPANECANSNTRDLIAVEITVPFNKVALIPGNYLSGKSLIGRSAMRHE
jgi:Flp pilus assembly protein TadG